VKDQQVFDNYEHFWKEIVENPDGTLNKEQVMRELHDFSTLIGNLSKLYCYISGNVVSKPMTRPEAVLQLFEEQLTEAYERGYQEAMEDHLGPGSNDE
jgi:hypothetical protein